MYHEKIPADSIGISSTVGISEEDDGRICEEETSL